MSDFLNNVSQFITEAADKVGRKTDEIIAVQGMKGQIRTAQREIDKHYVELGKIVCMKYASGVNVAEEAKPHCEDVERLQKLIAQYQADIEEYKKDDYEDIWDDEDLEEDEAAEAEEQEAPAEEAPVEEEVPAEEPAE